LEQSNSSKQTPGRNISIISLIRRGNKNSLALNKGKVLKTILLNKQHFYFQRFISGTLSIFSLWVTPNLIINATLAGFVFLGHDVTAESAFTVISIFSILQDPIRSIPVVINFFIETYVSSKRI